LNLTAGDTPQQNHLTEMAFAAIANGCEALMHQANVTLDICLRLFCEATLHDGLITIKLNGKVGLRFFHWRYVREQA
jgi:hypothetical protein